MMVERASQDRDIQVSVAKRASLLVCLCTKDLGAFKWDIPVLVIRKSRSTHKQTHIIIAENAQAQ